MVTTLCISGNAAFKAGTSHTSLPDADYTTLINQAEGVIAAATRKDWVAAYSGMSDNTKKILEDTASSLVAIQLVKRDISANSTSSRIEGEDMINVDRDTALRNISILRDVKTQDFLN